MKSIIVIATLALSLSICSKGGDAGIHFFRLWGKMDEMAKFNFYQGFTNGLGEGVKPHKMHGGPRTEGHILIDCLLDDSSTLTTPQAIAMIDKYYQDHPEKWNLAIGGEIFEALMVKGGPCAAR
jgi:hypothetical protein